MIRLPQSFHLGRFPEIFGIFFRPGMRMRWYPITTSGISKLMVNADY